MKCYYEKCKNCDFAKICEDVGISEYCLKQNDIINNYEKKVIFIPGSSCSGDCPNCSNAWCIEYK